MDKIIQKLENMKHGNVVIGSSRSIARDTLLQGENQGLDMAIKLLQELEVPQGNRTWQEVNAQKSYQGI